MQPPTQAQLTPAQQQQQCLYLPPQQQQQCLDSLKPPNFNLSPQQMNDLGGQVAQHEQYYDDVKEHQKSEQERVAEEAGNTPDPNNPAAGPQLCPEGKGKCIQDCEVGEPNWDLQQGCVRTCWEHCQDPSVFDTCSEGKPACVEHCEQAAGRDDSFRTGCKARCVNACCPEGVSACKDSCDTKPDPEIPICKAMCDSSCMKLPEDL